jgi:hypothetical protein
LDWVGSAGFVPGVGLLPVPEVELVAGPVVELLEEDPGPVVVDSALGQDTAVGDTALGGMQAAYTDRNYHNTIDHTVEYTSIDRNIWDMCSFYHLFFSNFIWLYL